MENEQQTTWRTQAPVVALSFFVLALAIGNYFLVSQNRDLTKRIVDLYTKSMPPVGAYFPILTGEDLERKPITIDLTGRPANSLVLVTDPKCKACIANWPTWNSLLAASKAPSYLIDLYGTADANYLEKHHAAFLPSLHGLDPKIQTEYNVRVTPLTIVVSASGRIMSATAGILSADDTHEIIAELGARK